VLFATRQGVVSKRGRRPDTADPFENLTQMRRDATVGAAMVSDGEAIQAVLIAEAGQRLAQRVEFRRARRAQRRHPRALALLVPRRPTLVR
jgi:hypothetical protein